jgi:hypothetical protein
MLIWLDGTLLSVAQKFCDKAQWLTGVTKFTLRKWALIATAAFMVACTALVGDLYLLALTIIFVSTTAIEAFKEKKDEAKFLRNGSLAHTNWAATPERLAALVISCVGLAFLAFLALFVGLSHTPGQLFSCTLVCYLASVYFAVCIPLPPGKSKAREWYEKRFRWLKDVFGPSLTP